MGHCADDDDYDGRRMELEGGRGRERDSRATGESGGEGERVASVGRCSQEKRERERERERAQKGK